MADKIRPARDRFAFSLGGAASANTHTLIPAIADDLRQERKPARPRDVASGDVAANGSRTVREFEEFLARYFAPGCQRPV